MPRAFVWRGKRAWYTLQAHVPSSPSNLYTTLLQLKSGHFQLTCWMTKLHAGLVLQKSENSWYHLAHFVWGDWWASTWKMASLVLEPFSWNGHLCDAASNKLSVFNAPLSSSTHSMVSGRHLHHILYWSRFQEILQNPRKPVGTEHVQTVCFLSTHTTVWGQASISIKTNIV